MKAALLTRPGEAMEIVDVEIDEPGPNEVKIKTSAVGLCRSDLHFLDGVYPYPMPTVLGHEAAGVVEAVGSEVGHVKPGDHVVTFLAPSCGICRMCQNGQFTRCQNPALQRPREGRQRLSLGGEPIAQFLNLSAFAERMLVHGNACVAIRDDMPMDRAALIGCSVVTGAGTVFNACEIEAGETIAIVGAGGIGLSAINAARIAGASEIVAIDPVASKRATAEKMGATLTFDASEENVVEPVLEATGGGVDHAVECVGKAVTTQLAWKVLRRGGRAVVVGMIPPGEMVEIHGPEFLQGKEIKGALMGAGHFMQDMPRLCDHYCAGRLDLDTVIAERITLEQVNEGFDKLRGGESTRSVIVFD